jgi:OOP family OmpA-OmpF porin
MDWNNYTIHSNDVAYSSRAYGLDARLGVPFEEWLPYVKLGYGRSTGAGNDILGSVAQKSSNIAFGVEYNVASRWSLVAEFKKDSFSNRDKSITINNRIFAFGFNYYFDKPIKDDTVKVVEEYIPIPEPIIAPDAIPEDAPPP